MNSSLTFAERPALREAQVMRIRRLAAANQTRLVGHVSDMVAVANPARLREGEDAFVDAPAIRFAGECLLKLSTRLRLSD